MEKLLQNTEQQCGKSNSSIHTITRPLPEVLGTLIKVIEQEEDSIDDLKDLATKISSRFNVTCTESDLVNFYQPRICEIESEILYKQYGYNKI